MVVLNIDDVVKQLLADRSKGAIEKLALILRQQRFDLKQLIDITFSDDDNLAFRAVWLLDATLLGDMAKFTDDIPYLISRMPQVKHPGCQRQYARVMMHLTNPKAPKTVQNVLHETDLELVVEKCFDWIIDPKVKVAVKVFAADTLFNLRHRYDWVGDELANQVEFMMRNGSAAIQSRGKKILAGLKK